MQQIHALEFARDEAFASRAHKSALRGDAMKHFQTLRLYNLAHTVIQDFLSILCFVQVPPSPKELIPPHLTACSNTHHFKVPYTLEVYAALETAALVFNGVPSHLNSKSMHRGTGE